MSDAIKKSTLEIPQRMRSKLQAFQRRVWIVKLIEACGAAICGLMLSYLAVFVLDRFVDTDWKMRAAILVIGSLGLAVWLPWMCHRWIWRSRRLHQVARLLKVNHPRLGDYVLGIIELVNQPDFNGTSEALCRAALKQADESTANRNFTDAVPWPKHRRWMLCAAIPLTLAAVALLVVPSASTNALARWLQPWKNIDRYTFTQIQPLPDQMIVPLAESSTLGVELDDSQWNPEQGAVLIGGHRVEAHLHGLSKADEPAPLSYQFPLPPLSTPTDVDVRIGDVRERIKVVPHARPELSELSADIRLPDYLQRTANVQQDLRGGSLALLNGSEFSLCATATRSLSSASINGKPLKVDGSVIRTDKSHMDQPTTMELQWLDSLGLSAKKPLTLNLRSAEDQPPELICRVLEKQRVMMVKDVLTFEVDADDDFGIKTIGMEWTGKPDDTSAETPAEGEKIVYAGNPESTDVEALTAAFSPARESIGPQTIQLRLFAEDYLPTRERVYSPVYTLFVLSVDDHAIWMTRRLDQWFKQSLETYEQEQLLYKRNLQIRNMDSGELDSPETRRQITNQATAEASQARRLGALTKAGEGLVQEAARNEHFGVDHLEKLAGMIQRLKDIEGNRMPSVADLLKQAAEAEAGAGGESNKSEGSKSVSDSPKMAGESPQKKPADKSPDDQPAGKKAPSVNLTESSMTVEPEKEGEPEAEPAPPSGPGKLTLPSVSVAALPDDGTPKPAQACPAGGKMEAATDAQDELLAEFQKVAEELQKLISDLEGSTFVKRFKAMARRELVVAKDITGSTLTGFGESQNALKESTVTRMELLAKRQKAHGLNLQTIEDDLAAYTTRETSGKFKTVLAEMRKLEAVQQTNQVATRIATNEPGTSIAHAEMLADTFDRWAEQLVGPG